MINVTKKWIFLKLSGAILIPFMLWFILSLNSRKKKQSILIGKKKSYCHCQKTKNCKVAQHNFKCVLNYNVKNDFCNSIWQRRVRNKERHLRELVRIKLFKFKQKPPVYRELNNVIRIKKTQVWGPLFSCLFVVCCLMLTQYSSHVWIGFKQRMVSNEIYHEQHSCIYVLILSFIKILKFVQ